MLYVWGFLFSPFFLLCKYVQSHLLYSIHLFSLPPVFLPNFYSVLTLDRVQINANPTSDFFATESQILNSLSNKQKNILPVSDPDNMCDMRYKGFVCENIQDYIHLANLSHSAPPP